MEIGGHIIGVCSWSLQPKGMSDLIAKVKSLSLSHMQLDLTMLLDLEETVRAETIAQLKQSGIQLTAGMVHFAGEDYSKISVIKQTGGYVPDAKWMERRDLTADAARVAKHLGLTKLSTHVGFIPASSDLGYAKIVEHVREIAQICGDQGVDLLMESGQEAAPELLQFLNDVPASNVFINFDPANMVLYGAGNPLEAISILNRHIAHVHIKDAKYSQNPGSAWGDEVPFGTGEVPPGEFIGALHEANYQGPLVIEREAGTDRIGDVRFAIEALRQAL